MRNKVHWLRYHNCSSVLCASSVRADIQSTNYWFVINHSLLSWRSSLIFRAIAREECCTICSLHLLIWNWSWVNVNFWVNLMWNSNWSVIKKLRRRLLSCNVVFTRLLIDWKISVLLFDLSSVSCGVWFVGLALSWPSLWVIALFLLHRCYWLCIFLRTSNLFSIILSYIRCIKCCPNLLSSFNIIFVFGVLRRKYDFIPSQVCVLKNFPLSIVLFHQSLFLF